MFSVFKPTIMITLKLTVICGLIYPFAITGIAQVVFPRQANGSLTLVNGQAIGSDLIGQNFASPKYFHPRPSAAGDKGYDGMASGGSNLAPSKLELDTRLAESGADFHKEKPGRLGCNP